MRTTWIGAGLVCFTLVAPQVARAAEPPEGAGETGTAEGTDTSAPAVDAAAEKREGDDAMVALRYAEALEHYERAFAVTKSPALLYNMGRAYEGLGEFPKALDALQKFADEAPPELRARVPKLDELLGDVRSHVSTLTISSNVPGAEIRLGQKVIGKTGAGPSVFRVNAGPRHLTIEHPDYFPFDKDLKLPGNAVETVNAELGARSTSGVITIRSPVSGARVAVDGRAVGVVPAESVVAPGSHTISLERSGYDTATTRVVVAAGERKSVDVPMAEHETIAEKWWFWTAVGVVVVGGAVGGYLAATQERAADTGTIPPGQVKANGFGLSF